MEKIKKEFGLKIILILASAVFILQSIAYGNMLSKKLCIRLPLLTAREDINRAVIILARQDTSMAGRRPDAYFLQQFYKKGIALFGEGAMMTPEDLNVEFQGQCEELRWSVINSFFKRGALNPDLYQKQQLPTDVIVLATDRCNHRCPFCISNASPEGAIFIDRVNLRAALSQIREKASAYPRVLLTGGEPLLHPEIMAILRENAPFIKGLFTNASFAQTPQTAREMVQEIFKNLEASGTDTEQISFKISLDSFHGDTERSIRCVDNLIEAIWIFFPTAGVDLSCQRIDQRPNGENPLLFTLFDILAEARIEDGCRMGNIMLVGKRDVLIKRVVSYNKFSFIDLDKLIDDPFNAFHSVEVRHYPLIFQNRGFLLLGEQGYTPDSLRPRLDINQIGPYFKPIELNTLYIAADGIVGPLDALIDDPKPLRLSTISDVNFADETERHMQFDIFVRLLSEPGGIKRIIELSAEFDKEFTEKLINTPLFMRDNSIDNPEESLRMSSPQILYWITINPERRLYITLRLLQQEFLKAGIKIKDIPGMVININTPPSLVRKIASGLIGNIRQNKIEPLIRSKPSKNNATNRQAL